MSACRWIEGEDFREKLKRGEFDIYCGAPTVNESSYCPAHHHIVWRKATSRPVRSFAGAAAAIAAARRE